MSISVRIDFTKPDAGYKSLHGWRLKRFLRSQLKLGNNLIQTTQPFSLKKTTLRLSAIPYTSWSTVAWRDIKCKSINSWIKRSPCTKGSKRSRVFARLDGSRRGAGFASYLNALYDGSITRDDHILFIKTLRETFGDKRIQIHNQDIHWFHVKTY